MSIIASLIKIVVAGIYSTEALQAKQDQKSKALQNLAKTQCAQSKRDQESPPQQLLPFRETQTEPQTHLQHLIAQVSELFKNLSFGLLEQENVHHYPMHAVMIMVTLKLIMATESDHSLEFLMKAVQVGVILMLVYVQLSNQTEPKQLQQKLGISALLLVASEYLQLYWLNQTGRDDNVILFSLVEMLVFVLGVTLSTSIECIYTSSKLRADNDIRTQGATNKLANFIFQDTTEDGTQAGYAVLHVDTTISASPEFCLLRYNARLENLLTGCKIGDTYIEAPHDSGCDSLQVEARSSGSFARKKALTERLMSQQTSKHQIQQSNSLLMLSSDESQAKPITFKRIFMQKHSQLTQDHLLYADKGEQLPLLFNEVFTCDNSDNGHGRGILKTKNHSDLQISVRVLCRESSCFVVKIQHKPLNKLPTIPSSNQEKQQQMKKSPSKKVSFNQHEKSAPQLSSHEQKQQERQESLQINCLSKSRSLDDISSPDCKTESDKKNEMPDPLICKVLEDIDSNSSANEKFESLASAQSCAETEPAQTQTNICSSSENLINHENQNVLPLLDCLASVENDGDENDTPSFSSSQQNCINFTTQTAQLVQQQELNKMIENELLPSLDDSKNQNEQSPQNLRSKSESVESDEIRPETHEQPEISQQLQGSSLVQNNSVLRKFEQLQVKANCHTETILKSAERSHKDLAGVPTIRLEFNSQTNFDQIVPYHSDEAQQNSRSSLQGGGKETLFLTTSSYLDQNKDNKDPALSMYEKKLSSKENTLYQGCRSSSSFKRLSCETFQLDLDGNRERIQRKPKSGLFAQMMSGRVYRTSIISDNIDSPLFQQPSGDLKSKASKQSKTLLQNSEAKIKANKLFVYKIIHDLRHPTDSVSQGLTELVKAIPMEKFVNDPNLRPNNENIFQYIAHNRVEKALKICTSAISAEQSQSSNLAQTPHLFSQQSSYPSQASSMELSPKKNRTEKQMSHNKLNLVLAKESGQVDSPLLINKMKDGKPQKLQEDEQPSFKHKLKKLYVDFNSIEIKKIELDKKIHQVPYEEQKQPNNEMPQHPEEEEKQSVQSGRLPLHREELPQQINKSQSSESVEGLQIDDNISEGSSKVSCIFTAKEPQKKQFQREQVHDLVQKGLEDPRNKSFERKPFTLAADILIYKSSVMEQIRNSNSMDPKQPQQRSKSCLLDVLNVIDIFKRESEGKCLSNKDVHISGRNFSMMSEKKPEHNLISENELVSLSRGVEQKFENPRSRLSVSQSVSAHHSFISQKEITIESNQSRQDYAIDSKLRRSIKILQSERKYLVTMVNDLLVKTITTRNRMETMEGQTGMMMMLLRDLMNQAQLGNNTFTMVNEYFNVCTLIKRCIQLLKSQANIKNVQLNGPILQNPSDSSYFHFLFSDERRYGQFILNFLTNSIKFTPSGGQVTVLLKIKQVSDLSHNNKSNKSEKSGDQDKSSLNSSISANSVPDKEILPDLDHANDLISKPAQKSNSSADLKMVHFEMIFRDTGVGISPENQNKLFQNFGKVSETQEVNKSGVGLGLSICKEIINAHGGSVDIESEIDKGTDFIINLKQKCMIDHNWQTTMQENEKQDQLKLYDSNIQPIIIREESEHSSDSFSGQDTDGHNSDKQLLDESSPWNQQRQNRSYFANEAQSNNEALGNDNGNLMKRFLREPHLSTIHEGGSKEYSNESSVVSRFTRCLIANDDLFLLITYEAVLKNHFEQVDKVENGQAALDCVRAQPNNYYSVIILDIQMPIMNGIQACTEILAHFGQEQEKNSDPVFLQPKKSSSKSIQSDSIHSFGRYVKDRQYPFVYALTSESEPEQIEEIMKAGFKETFNVMDQVMIRMVLENAGLVYREKNLQLSLDRSPEFDARKLSLSSYDRQSNQNQSKKSESSGQSELQQRINFQSEDISIQKEPSQVSDDQDQAPYQQ